MKLDSIINLSDVTYGYSLKSTILEGIHLTIYKGQYIGLLGPSGSGKTTLLKIIVGLIKPRHGSITFVNNSSLASNRPTIGYVPQVESVDWNFPVTVKEVVAMGVWNQSGIAPWLKKNTKEEVDDVPRKFRHRRLWFKTNT